MIRPIRSAVIAAAPTRHWQHLFQAFTLSCLLALTALLPLSELRAQGEDEAIEAAKSLEATRSDEMIARVVTRWMLHMHYDKPELNDQVSAEIFERYFTQLDPEHAYFLQRDLDEFSSYRLILDNLLESGDVDFAFAVYERFVQRVAERTKYIEQRISEPFDYSTDEELLIDRKSSAWAETTEQLDELWRKRLKNQMLVHALTHEELERAKAAREAKAADADTELPDVAQSTEERPSSQTQILDRYKEYLQLLRENDSSDVLELYLTTFTQVFDPHSTYFNWRTSEDFDISMKLSLQGIGATLTMENGYTKIVSIVPGGPAALDGRLKAGDHILAVGQGDNELEDVVNVPLNKVVRKIRGEKGTTVSLSVAKDVHDMPRVIQIVRDEVKLRDQEAQGEVIDYLGPDGITRKVGVVFLPSFYADFEALRTGDANAKSTTSDVRKMVDKMVAEDKISGLIMDLRYNGGGSLTEAINLAGLFIPSGPIVQVREREGINVYADSDGGFAYTMPLAVITNRASASASEIFAAAIQDYGRGVIIGDEATHGKGTVQTVRQLNSLLSLRNANPGALKFTMAKFYRVNGGSTQQRGVRPDFVLPSFLDHIVKGESDLEHAMAWDEIEARDIVRAKPDVTRSIEMLRARHEARLAEDEQFRSLVEDIQKYGERRQRKTISLNKEQRQELRKEDEYWAERSEQVLSKTKRSRFSEQGEDRRLEADFYMRESLNILSDLINLTQAGSTIARGGRDVEPPEVAE